MYSLPAPVLDQAFDCLKGFFLVVDAWSSTCVFSVNLCRRLGETSWYNWPLLSICGLPDVPLPSISPCCHLKVFCICLYLTEILLFLVWFILNSVKTDSKPFLFFITWNMSYWYNPEQHCTKWLTKHCIYEKVTLVAKYGLHPDPSLWLGWSNISTLINAV